MNWSFGCTYCAGFCREKDSFKHRFCNTWVGTQQYAVLCKLESGWGQRSSAPQLQCVHTCLKTQGPREQCRETNTLHIWNQINTLSVTQTVEPTNHESYSGINLISTPVFNWAVLLLQKNSVGFNGNGVPQKFPFVQMRYSSAFESFHRLQQERQNSAVSRQSPTTEHTQTCRGYASIWRDKGNVCKLWICKLPEISAWGQPGTETRLLLTIIICRSLCIKVNEFIITI